MNQHFASASLNATVLSRLTTHEMLRTLLGYLTRLFQLCSDYSAVFATDSIPLRPRPLIHHVVTGVAYAIAAVVRCTQRNYSSLILCGNGAPSLSNLSYRLEVPESRIWWQLERGQRHPSHGRTRHCFPKRRLPPVFSVSARKWELCTRFSDIRYRYSIPMPVVSST